jgi:uncharacterized phiE125 gp8 family phage protein
MLSTRLITPPAIEPVTLGQAKQQLVLDDSFDADDTLITAYITAARQYVEKRLNRAIYNQTWLMTMDVFPIWGQYDSARTPAQRNVWPYTAWLWDKLTIRLPHSRLVSITSITYTDPDGNPQTLDPSQYNIDTTSQPGRLGPLLGSVWPIVCNWIPGNVKITYVAGSYGDGIETDDCPQTIKLAILLLVSHWYAHREATTEATLTNIPLGVDALIDCDKVHTVGGIY